MKQFKEYPATHSMSTAWYAVDEEGNVAIMDYNENGPVPWQTEQTCTEELVFGHDEDNKNKVYLPIQLTDDQIYELLDNPREPKDDYDNWCFDPIVQIDMNQEKAFLELVKQPDIKLKRCLSKSLGLYMLVCYDCFTDKRDAIHAHPLKRSSLYKMLASKMILKVYNAKKFYVDDEMKDGEAFFNPEFDSAPYFIYCQPYWDQLLAERINIPEHPVKISQFPAILQKRVHRVPIKFRECKKFQIAEWHSCDFYPEEEKVVNGCRYGLLTLTDGTKAYVMSDMDNVSFYPYCSEKERYDCKTCPSECAICFAYFYTNKPTVMTIVSPYSKFDYNKKITSDPIVRKSVIMPFLPIIPKPLGLYVFANDAKKVISTHMLEELFLKNYHYLEDMVARYNPRVIIIDNKAKQALSRIYSFDNHRIKIGDKEYPLFLESEIKRNREEIERLAESPYQGIVMPHIISIEEMEKIQNEHND